MTVSVIIPTHNRASTIARAVESVLSQSQPVDEIIVIDDRSTDDTLLALRPMLDKIVYVTNDRQLGSQGSRNRGIGLARSDVLAFLDSDDFWHPRKIQLQLEAAKQWGGEEFCVTCGYSQIVEQREVKYVPPKMTDIYSVMVHNLIGPTSNILISRNLIDAVGLFDPAMPSCQDWELFVRILDKVPIIGVERILTYQDVDSGARISANRRKVLSGHQAMFQRMRETAQFRGLPLPARLSVLARQQFALAKRWLALPATP